jgi:putative transcriptional regulator
MSKPKENTEVGKLLVQGAREALAHNRGKLSGARVTQAKATVRSVNVVPPPEYGDRDVRRVRQQLGVSQTVFADLIGASPATVRAWERGARRPSAMARRLLALAEREPQAFEEDLVVLGSVDARAADRMREAARELRENWR